MHAQEHKYQLFLYWIPDVRKKRNKNFDVALHHLWSAVATSDFQRQSSDWVFYFRSCHDFHLLLPALMCWVPQSIEQQTHGNHRIPKASDWSLVLVAIVARCFFSGFDAIKNPKSSCCHEMAASSSAAAKWHLFSGPCGDHADPPLSIPSLFLAVYVFLHCNCLNCSPGGVTYLQ